MTDTIRFKHGHELLAKDSNYESMSVKGGRTILDCMDIHTSSVQIFRSVSGSCLSLLYIDVNDSILTGSLMQMVKKMRNTASYLSPYSSLHWSYETLAYQQDLCPVLMLA